jgi:hypothetical protein
MAALVSEGLLDQETEDKARRYLEIQDKGWSSAPVLTSSTPLFLDSLAITYLQTVDLFESLLRHFNNVWLDSSTEEEMLDLIQQDELSIEVLRIIDEIRTATHKVWVEGKLAFGPKYSGADEEGTETGQRPRPSILNLLADLKAADAVLIDDRALNKEEYAVDRGGHRTPVVTSLDVIEDFKSRGALSDIQYRTLRHRLRAAGAALVPLTSDEVASAALRSRGAESAELRAIRESIAITRSTGICQFPSEIPWFSSTIQALYKAIAKIWSGESDLKRATLISDALFQMRPRPAEWEEQWRGVVPPNWHNAVEELLTASLAIPTELERGPALDAYNRWIEKTVLEPMRRARPDAYSRIVQRVREFILSPSRAEDGDDESA